MPKDNTHEPPFYCIVHVDDIGYTGTTRQCEEFEAAIGHKETGFSVDYLGRLGVDAKAMRYLGIEIERKEDRFELHNSQLLENLLKKSGKQSINTFDVPIRDIRLSANDCPKNEEERKAVEHLPYRAILGQCGWIATTTNPPISYAYKELARFANNFGRAHWNALLELVGYLKKYRNKRLIIARGGGMLLFAYCDADWNGCKDTHLSTTGWIIFLGDAPISWCAKTQRCVAKSTAESEYVSLASLAQELIYLQMLCESLKYPTTTIQVFSNKGTNDQPGCVTLWHEYKQNNPICTPSIYSDSQNAIANARMPPGWLQEALRHVKTAFHFFKQFVYEKLITLEHCRSEDNCADIMTKGSGKAKNNNQKAPTFSRHADFCLGYR
jgi:hypothetical protein